MVNLCYTNQHMHIHSHKKKKKTDLGVWPFPLANSKSDTDGLSFFIVTLLWLFDWCINCGMDKYEGFYEKL